VIFFLESSFI